ncbi:unnamed protein product [Peniophora sp. CBMAI 1063]|nr:unnamed protein product [Peniophora sp. CBMAI 1063]
MPSASKPDLPPRRKDYCSLCKDTSAKLMTCKDCKSIKYCSVTCQRLDWKSHKPRCAQTVQLHAEWPSRTRVTMDLVRRARLCSVEWWLQILAVAQLDLMDHPERASTHALLLRWEIAPVMSPREYSKHISPRPRFNTSGQRRHMLSLTHYTMHDLDMMQQLEHVGIAGATDWKNFCGRRPHEADISAELDEGEPDPMQVVCVNMVDPTFVGDGSPDAVSVRSFTIRVEMLREAMEIQQQMLPQKGLPGENLQTFCLRHINELIIHDVENKWKLRTARPAEETP